MQQITHCPLCNSIQFATFLVCKDHLLSNKEFTITECENCYFRFTNPRPPDDQLQNFYKSQNYISHSNIRKGFTNRLYHLVRNYTIRKKFSIVKKYASSTTLLDIGCGTGELLSYFKTKGWQAYGLEPDKNARDFAINNYNLNVIDFPELPQLQPSFFNVITMWHVLEHISNLNDFISMISNLLKENGTLIVAVPNSGSWDASHYKSFWAAYDVPRHLYHFTTETIIKLMKNHHFFLEKIIPMRFDSYYISLLSEKNKTGQTNYLSGFFHGILSNFSARINNKNYSSLIYVFNFGNN